MDVRYIAGFFDGEGCIIINKDNHTRHQRRPSYSLQVVLGNTDRRPLDWLCEKFGGHIRAQSREAQKTVYYWQIMARKASRFLEWIRPHLLIKEVQAWLGLEFVATKGIGGGRGRPLSNEQYALREGFYLALQQAKKE